MHVEWLIVYQTRESERGEGRACNYSDPDVGAMLRLWKNLVWLTIMLPMWLRSNPKSPCQHIQIKKTRFINSDSNATFLGTNVMDKNAISNLIRFLLALRFCFPIIYI